MWIDWSERNVCGVCLEASTDDLERAQYRNMGKVHMTPLCNAQLDPNELRKTLMHGRIKWYDNHSVSALLIHLFESFNSCLLILRVCCILKLINKLSYDNAYLDGVRVGASVSF
jgi:hypothetical protein